MAKLYGKKEVQMGATDVDGGKSYEVKEAFRGTGVVESSVLVVHDSDPVKI